MKKELFFVLNCIGGSSPEVAHNLVHVDISSDWSHPDVSNVHFHPW